MPEPVQQVRGTNYAAGTENSLVRDVSKKIFQLQPDKYPLITFTNGLKGKKEAINPKFEWFEDELQPNVVTLANAETTGSTSFELTTGQGPRAQVDDVLIGATGESLLVTAISGDTLTVTRSFGDVAAASYSASDQLVLLGKAMLEGADAPAFRFTKKVVKDNVIQIFRDTVELTDSQIASESYGGDDRVYQRMKKGIEHARSIEQAFLLGDYTNDTSGTQARRATKGLINWITTNVDDMGGVITEAELETHLRKLFRYHPTVSAPTKLAIWSPMLISAANFWAKNALRVRSDEKTFGVRIAEYRSGHGDLDIVKHWLLEDFTDFKKYGFNIDTMNVKYRFLRGLDTKLHLDIGLRKTETKMDEYRTHCGLQLIHERSHGIIKNVTGYAP